MARPHEIEETQHILAPTAYGAGFATVSLWAANAHVTVILASPSMPPQGIHKYLFAAATIHGATHAAASRRSSFLVASKQIADENLHVLRMSGARENASMRRNKITF